MPLARVARAAKRLKRLKMAMRSSCQEFTWIWVQRPSHLGCAPCWELGDAPRRPSKSTRAMLRRVKAIKEPSQKSTCAHEAQPLRYRRREGLNEKRRHIAAAGAQSGGRPGASAGRSGLSRTMNRRRCKPGCRGNKRATWAQSARQRPSRNRAASRRNRAAARHNRAAGPWRRCRSARRFRRRADRQQMTTPGLPSVTAHRSAPRFRRAALRLQLCPAAAAAYSRPTPTRRWPGPARGRAPASCCPPSAEW